MMLDTIRETIERGKSKQYSVYLCGARVGTGDTKEKAQAVAEKTLSDAYEYQLSRNHHGDYQHAS